MNSTKSPLDLWLADIASEANNQDETWDPGFDGSRRLVVAKLGPYRKAFPRPQKFTPRFYHRIFQLPIEDWSLTCRAELYGGFCSLEINLTIHFQASIHYAMTHIETLPEINSYIKKAYESLVRDVIDQEIKKLDDGEWIESGLAPIEKRIQTQINETLITQHIQCRALCSMQPSFADVTQSQNLSNSFAREDIYLKIQKKNFEFKERQNRESLRQQEEQERLLIEKRNRETELKIKEQALESESNLRLLKEQERQITEQFSLEERLYMERVRHQARLQELEQETQRELQRQQLAKQLETEQRLQEEKLRHQQLLKEKELAAELKQFEEQQAQWNAAKERMQQEKLKQEQRLKQIESEAERALAAQKQSEAQKLQEKLHAERLQHESRLKEMELAMQIEEQKKRYEATQETSEYLRRDIELLVLEKRRNEMIQAAKKAKQPTDQTPRELPLNSEPE
ncbi:hypothetical protein [Methylotuvimicrobium sp. KM1]|uniref:hypothetical protein n=1 Tax=Methylotuvimicrobium sp. KM1 TaxID=3377707 RepID=UPI00384D082B